MLGRVESAGLLFGASCSEVSNTICQDFMLTGPVLPCFIWLEWDHTPYQVGDKETGEALSKNASAMEIQKVSRL